MIFKFIRRHLTGTIKWKGSSGGGGCVWVCGCEVGDLSLLGRIQATPLSLLNFVISHSSKKLQR